MFEAIIILGQRCLYVLFNQWIPSVQDNTRHFAGDQQKMCWINTLIINKSLINYWFAITIQLLLYVSEKTKQKSEERRFKEVEKTVESNNRKKPETTKLHWYTRILLNSKKEKLLKQET